MLLSTHDKGLNLKPLDVIQLQGYSKSKVNNKHLIVLTRAPIRKAECKETIGNTDTKEWSEGQDLAQLMSNVSLDVPQS
jgi:hypothetical protein